MKNLKCWKKVNLSWGDSYINKKKKGSLDVVYKSNGATVSLPNRKSKFFKDRIKAEKHAENYLKKHNKC